MRSGAGLDRSLPTSCWQKPRKKERVRYKHGRLSGLRRPERLGHRRLLVRPLAHLVHRRWRDRPAACQEGASHGGGGSGVSEAIDMAWNWQCEPTCGPLPCWTRHGLAASADWAAVSADGTRQVRCCGQAGCFFHVGAAGKYGCCRKGQGVVREMLLTTVCELLLHGGGYCQKLGRLVWPGPRLSLIMPSRWAG